MDPVLAKAHTFYAITGSVPPKSCLSSKIAHYWYCDWCVARKIEVSTPREARIMCLRDPTIYGHDDVIKWMHFPRYWPFVRGIHRWPVNSQHKGQWRGALLFSLISAWIIAWVNNREGCDLRRHRARYDFIVMVPLYRCHCAFQFGHDMGYLSRFMRPDKNCGRFSTMISAAVNRITCIQNKISLKCIPRSSTGWVIESTILATLVVESENTFWLPVLGSKTD